MCLRSNCSSLKARTAGELDKAFDEAVSRGADALLISADFFTSQRAQIVALAAHYMLTVSYPWPQYVEAGGLISYGTNLKWAYEQIGDYTGRILKGATPNDLPVQLPTTFEMTINLKTVKALGLSLSPLLLARADKAIE